MATGQTIIDFGTFPGTSDTFVDVTGQAGILSTSFVEAWLVPTATADHSADEHILESIKIIAGNIVAGTGFTIYAINTSSIHEPMTAVGASRNHRALGAAASNVGFGSSNSSVGGLGTRIYGKWTVAWVWV